MSLSSVSRESLKPSVVSASSRYAERVNPQWVRLLDLLGMNVRYERCLGAELWSEGGDRYLDFLSGYCVHNAGHNHPRIIEALKEELDRSGPAMLQSHVLDNEFWRAGFGPLLPHTEAVPFNDVSAVEQKLQTRKFAAFIVEPIQSEGGIRIPSPDYLRQVQSLCKRYGTLFVLDEVQTGMFRTGKFLAAHHFDVQPDVEVWCRLRLC